MSYPSYPNFNPSTGMYTDCAGQQFTTPGGPPVGGGQATSHNSYGQPVQGWWNGQNFIPNK